MSITAKKLQKPLKVGNENILPLTTMDQVLTDDEGSRLNETIHQNLAPIELTSTATNPYRIGQFFVYNNLLYKATAAIGIGDTITPGTNCVTDTVGNEITTVKESLSTNDYYKTEGFTENTSFGSVAGLRIRVGKTVYLSFEVTLTASLPSTTILFTVPNGFKPALNTNSLLVLYKPASADITFYTRVAPIDTDGNIKQNVSSNAPSGARIVAYYAYKTNDAEPS